MGFEFAGGEGEDKGSIGFEFARVGGGGQG
jgi:hypothetical protein